MKISKLPLRIEPGLVALLCAWFYFDPAGTFLPFVCAAALHEAGHLAMLLWLRQPVHSLCLGLQGAVLRTGPLRYRDELLAAAAGPAMNLALLLAFSRTLPCFALVNFCLLAYNLLPFYPLDGGRLRTCAISDAITSEYGSYPAVPASVMELPLTITS